MSDSDYDQTLLSYGSIFDIETASMLSLPSDWELSSNESKDLYF